VHALATIFGEKCGLAAVGVACLLLSPAAVHAQAVGNPVFSSYDFVLQATMEYGSSDRDLDAGRQKAEDSQLDTALVKLVLGVHPRFDLYLMVGTVSFDLCTGDAQEICGQDGDVSGASDIAYGGGARWTFWDGERVDAALGVSTLLFSVSDKVQNTDLSVDWWEYEVYAGASFPIFRHATPYLGASYSVVDAQFDGPNSVDMEADEPFGVFLGVDLPLGNYFSVTAEGRFIDQTTWSVGVNARY
jgi:hypothetical protein